MNTILDILIKIELINTKYNQTNTLDGHVKYRLNNINMLSQHLNYANSTFFTNEVDGLQKHFKESADQYFKETNLIACIEGNYAIYSNGECYLVDKHGLVTSFKNPNFNITLFTSLAVLGDILFHLDVNKEYNMDAIDELLPIIQELDSYLGTMNMIGL